MTTKTWVVKDRAERPYMLIFQKPGERDWSYAYMGDLKIDTIRQADYTSPYLAHDYMRELKENGLVVEEVTDDSQAG